MSFLLSYSLVCIIAIVSSQLAWILFLKDRTVSDPPPILQVTSGYISLTSIAIGTMALVSPRNTWLIILFIMIGRLLWLVAQLGLRRVFSEIRTPLRVNWRSLTAIFLLCQLFLTPLFLKFQFGPFSESGGDCSIYAEVADWAVSKNFPIYGFQDSIEKWGAIFNKPLDVISHSPHTGDNMTLDEINPIRADFHRNRILAMRRFPSVMIAPFALWGATNPSSSIYPAYFATLGLHYAFAVACFFSWVIAFASGYAPLLLGSVLLASYGFISTAYNHYAQQFLSMALFSFVWAGLARPTFERALIIPIIFASALIGFGYIHFALGLAPILFFLFFQRKWQKGEIRFKPFDWASTLVVTALIFFSNGIYGLSEGFLRLTQFVPTIARILKIEFLNPHAQRYEFYGVPTPILGIKWLSFLAGNLSQQHFPPFVTERRLLTWVGIACLVVFLGLVGMCLVCIIKNWKNVSRQNRKITLASLVSLAAFLIPAQVTLYTQAKGAQSALICLYALLGMPILFKTLGKFRTLYLCLLGAFAISMAIPHLYYSLALAKGTDRAGILELGLLNQIKTFVQENEIETLIFEPRNNADTYFIANSLYSSNARLIISRYAGNEWILDSHYLDEWLLGGTNPAKLLRGFNSAELLEGTPNVYHSPGEAPRILDSSGKGFVYRDGNQWKLVDLRSVQTPTLLYFADQYHRLFEAVPIEGKKHDFGWLNRGVLFLAIPTQCESMKLELIVRTVGRPAPSVEFFEKSWNFTRGKETASEKLYHMRRFYKRLTPDLCGKMIEILRTDAEGEFALTSQ